MLLSHLLVVIRLWDSRFGHFWKGQVQNKMVNGESKQVANFTELVVRHGILRAIAIAECAVNPGMLEHYLALGQCASSGQVARTRRCRARKQISEAVVVVGGFAG